jgi:hypothetical protein
MPEGTLKPELTQMTTDGQRVVEVYEVDGDDGTYLNTVPRESTLAEQAAHHADAALQWAVSNIPLAKAGTVEVGGSDEEPTLTITLLAEAPEPEAPEAAPQTAPAASKSKTAASTADKS